MFRFWLDKNLNKNKVLNCNDKKKLLSFKYKK